MKRAALTIFNSLTFFFLAINIGLPSTASGLSCAQAGPGDILEPAEHIRESEYVFTGTITNVVIGEFNRPGQNVHQVDIEQWHKGGSDSADAVLETDATWGGVYQAGTKALFVFAADDKSGSDPAFRQPLCSFNGTVFSSTDVQYAEYIDELNRDRPLVTLEPDEPESRRVYVIAATGIAAAALIALSAVLIRKRT